MHSLALLARRGCAVALALAVSATAASQTSIDQRLAGYRELIDEYRRQDADTMRRLAMLPAADVSALVERAAASANTDTRWSAENRQVAAMLHTDTAVELFKAAHAPEALFHLNAAGRLIDSTIDVSPAYSVFAERWYALAEGIAITYKAPVPAAELRQRARARFVPSPAQSALRNGRSEELAAARQGFHFRMLYRGELHGLDLRVAQRLMAAAREYEKALRLDSECLEASLHLGRVHMLLDDVRSAIMPLENAARAPDPRVRYLAIMFLGAIAEQQDQFDVAETRYREAAGIYPRSQSAALASTQLLSRTGREAEARVALEAYLARSRGMVVDPLWTYLIAPGDELGATLSELRVEVWR